MKTTILIAVAGIFLGGGSLLSAAGKERNEAEAVFPIGGYSGKPSQDKEAGFSLVGPGYRGNEKRLAEAEEVGLPSFYRVGINMDFHGKHGPAPTSLDEEKIRAEIEEQVKAVVDRDAIVGWYLTPEELRYWRRLELDYLRLASETIRNIDPKKRPVWMYEPGHRTRAALEKTAPFMQVVGKGVYTNYSGRKNDRIWVRWTLQQQQEAINAVNPEAVAYAVPEMFEEPPAEEKHLIPTWVRHDAYASMLSGVKGMVAFSFARRRGFRSKDLYYQEYAKFANEMNGPLKLGSVFLKGEPSNAPKFQVVEGNAETELPGGASGPKESVMLPSLATKAFAWRDGIYFFVVNSSQEPVTIRLNEREAWSPLLEGQPKLEGDKQTLQLPGYGVAAFKRPRA